jgi:anaerobic magnesium-protoporphyrin IX monomethyl ester cyclase
MKVLLIYSYSTDQAWVPIGLLYIAANLRKNNIDVKIIDSKYDSVFHEIISYNPDIVGLGGMTLMANNAIKLGKEIKQNFPNIILVYGGVHFTFMPEEAYDVADIIIKGEAERVFVEIIKKNIINNYEQPMLGILLKRNGVWLNYGDYELINDLDDLPLPAYDLIDITRYSDELVTGEKAISILTGRGCPYNCSFCASPKLWRRKVRYHSIEYTINHIKYLIDNYNLQNLRIMDDTFTCDNTRVIEFCNAVINNNFKLNMTCLTNVHNADLEVFKLMKKAGFSIVAFGLESVDENVLKLCNKQNTRENMTRAVKIAHEAGLKTELLFMVGNMGDTEKSLNDSLQFAKELSGYKTYFQLATPFPGCEFYDKAEQYGEIVSRDWTKYNHKKVTYIPNGLDEDTMYDIVKKGCVN